jgi:hypothetical protein
MAANINIAWSAQSSGHQAPLVFDRPGSGAAIAEIEVTAVVVIADVESAARGHGVGEVYRDALDASGSLDGSVAAAATIEAEVASLTAVLFKIAGHLDDVRKNSRGDGEQKEGEDGLHGGSLGFINLANHRPALPGYARVLDAGYCRSFRHFVTIVQKLDSAEAKQRLLRENLFHACQSVMRLPTKLLKDK